LPASVARIVTDQSRQADGVVRDKQGTGEAATDVPTTSEAGLPGFEYKIWYGMVASSKTPRAIVDQLAKELSAITQLKDISNAMENEGVTPRDVVTGEFDAFIAKEIAKFRDLANASGITKR
jgi:tripartite-type tricarboxylate transporter receptor subunit TctC